MDVSSGQRITRDWSPTIHGSTTHRRPLPIKHCRNAEESRVMPRVCNYDGSNRDGSGLPGVTGCSLKSITRRCFNIVRCRRSESLLKFLTGTRRMKEKIRIISVSYFFFFLFFLTTDFIRTLDVCLSRREGNLFSLSLSRFFRSNLIGERITNFR